MVGRTPVEIRRVNPIPVPSGQVQPIVVRPQPPVPVYISWTSGVNADQARVTIEAVREVLALAQQNRGVKIFGSGRWSQGDYSSADWYQTRAATNRDLGYGPQTNADQIINLMWYEPWQKAEGHLDVMVVDQDTWAGVGTNNSVFGLTFPHLAMVQSVARFNDPGPLAPTLLRVFKRVIHHEFGHLLGAPNRHTNVEENLGLHCTNFCCLRQGLSREIWIRQLYEEEAAGIIFCRECTANLRGQR